jgi:putative membrane protein
VWIQEGAGGVTYDLLRGLHILAVIAWMAGLLYLPRLFAYHTRAAAGSELDRTLQEMERKLYRIIMNPAMIAAWVLGGALIWFDATHRFPEDGLAFLLKPWMLAKLAGVVFLTWWQHYLGRARKAFGNHANTRPEKYWRAVNELPFLAAIVMVLAVTVGDSLLG